MGAAAGAAEVFALSLAPLGRPFPAGPPAGTRDYSVDVLAQGDRWSGPLVEDAAPALETVDGTVTGGDLVEIALRRAAELGLLAGDRLLTTEPWDGPAGWVDGLLVPLAAGASIVLVANPDPDHAAGPGAGRAGDRDPRRRGSRRPPPLTPPVRILRTPDARFPCGG